MEDPEARRDRLKRLREQVNGDGGSSGKADEELNASLQFRNYRPRDYAIGSKQKEAAKPRELDAPRPTALAEVTKDDQTAINAFAPKKPHQDLKRDVAKALRKLDRQTQRAIDELRVQLELQDAPAEADGSA